MRKRLLPLLAATTLLGFAGCSKTETTAANASTAKVLHFGNGTEPQDLDPQIVTGVP